MVSEKSPKPAKVEPVPDKDGKAPEDPAAKPGSSKTGELTVEMGKIAGDRAANILWVRCPSSDLHLLSLVSHTHIALCPSVLTK